MQIEDEWPPVFAIDLAQLHAREPVRQQPEIASTRHRQRRAQHRYCRRREFDQFLATGSRDAPWRARRTRNAIDVVANRKNARVVVEAGIANDVERPYRTRSDRP